MGAMVIVSIGIVWLSSNYSFCVFNPSKGEPVMPQTDDDLRDLAEGPSAN